MRKFNKKHASFAAIALLLMLFAGIGIYATIKGADEYKPENTVNAMDNTRSQVLVTGKDYKLDKKQKQKHQEEEKKRKKALEIKREENKQNRNREEDEQDKIEEQEEREEQEQEKKKKGNKPGKDNEPGNGEQEKEDDKGEEKEDDKGEEKEEENKDQKKKTPDNKKDDTPEEQETDDPSDIRKKKSGSGDGEDELTEEEKAKLPKIEIINPIKGEIIQGTRTVAKISAKDYKGRIIPPNSVGEGSIDLTCNGIKIGVNGGQGIQQSYQYKISNLQDGNNSITVTAIDRENRKKVTTLSFKCNASGQTEVIGSVTVSVSARSIGKGTMFNTSVDISRGDTVDDVVKKALPKGGFTAVFSGSYLAGVKKAGIAKDVKVSEEDRKKLEEERANEKDPSKQDPNSLKEHDIYSTSGWLYTVNEEFPEVGMGSYELSDGDQVVVLFGLSSKVY